ncbi:MAG: serpin family protein [Lachnospiraceae bacterium]|nr:serpin family protein [Lachnospiraceae bacterium]
MVKRGIYATITAITAMCALGACGNTETDSVISEQGESEALHSEEAGAAESDMTEPDTESQDAVNLTNESSIAITIDYDIQSYEDIQNFSYQLFGENLESQNPVLSPVSAYLALAMAAFGSDGSTKAEFDKLLGEGAMVISDDIMNSLPVESKNQILSLANSAWIDDQYLVDENWIGSIKSLLDAEAYQTDLSSTEAMNSMNDWIKTKTNEMINEMLTEPLDSDARLALFNTIYFKAKWSSPFEVESTYQDQFHVNENEQVEVDMMNKYAEGFDYISNDFAEGLIFPYRSDTEKPNLALLALKPKEGMTVREMYNNLNGDVISDMLKNKMTSLVNIKLPKFEISFEDSLNDSLMNMGLVDGFDPEKADFSLMGKNVSGNNLYISLVKQKAKIIVDEEGTEAAAATEVMMAEACALFPEEPIDVYFDEPFLYIIMDMDREIPLFMGILDNPAAIKE